MSTETDAILAKLEKIHSVVSEVQQDLVYLKTRDEEQKREWPQTQMRLKEIEERIGRTEEKIIILNSRTLNEERYFASVSSSLQNLDKKLGMINEKTIPELHKDVYGLKIKATMWGGVAGMVLASIISFTIKIFESFVRGG